MRGILRPAERRAKVAIAAVGYRELAMGYRTSAIFNPAYAAATPAVKVRHT